MGECATCLAPEAEMLEVVAIAAQRPLRVSPLAALHD